MANHSTAPHWSSARPRSDALGLRMLMGYKLVKGPLFLFLAATFTFWPSAADRYARELVLQLSDRGALALRLAHWLSLHLTASLEAKAAFLAWLDGGTTLLEGLLLASGKEWGEWLVVAGLAALVPFELHALVLHASWARAL